MRKELRLKRASDFKKAFKKGIRTVNPHFVLYVCENGLQQPRFGVSIAKKHCKLATRRNRLRRIAKELFRQKIAPEGRGCDYVITSRAKCNITPLAETVRNLKNIFSESDVKK